jgi:AraC family transcriptional regulator, transcriptional activator of pobA
VLGSGFVTNIRPVVRDDLTGNGWPVVAARRTHEDRRAVSRVPVTHSYAVVAFYTAGRARVEQNGGFEVREGDVLLVPAGEPHCTLETSRAEYWGLAFCVPCFAAHDAAGLLEPFERVRDGASPVVHLPSSRHAYVAGLFRELEGITHELARGSRQYSAACSP